MMIIMNPKSSSRPATVARALPPASSLSLSAALGEQFTALYGLVQRSGHVFGSPLGPLFEQGHSHHLPRFVYFGPEASDASVRLAFLAGFDHRDLRGTLSLLHLVEGLALNPDVGQRLNLTVFPIVDLLGLAGFARDTRLAQENWTRTEVPELRLLEQDARLNGYHGYVRLETTTEDIVVAQLRSSPHVENPAPAVDFVTSEDFEPYAVRWESEVGEATAGPLSVAADLSFQPFELTLRLPVTWAPELHREAVASILKKFIIRYRAFIAYGQHL